MVQQQAPPQQQNQAPPRGAPAAAPASPVIARVQGRPITQRDYDRIAEPYFARLKAQLGPGFDGDLKKTAIHNVLDELIRRELLVLEGERTKLAVSDADIDRMLSNDPLFQTNGTFDPAKLTQFKMSPQSNYREILPKLRETVIAQKMDEKVRSSLTPSTAVLREEWSKRNEQVRFKFLPLTLRDVSLDAESDEAEQLAYYKAHSADLEKKAQIGLRYL